MLAILLLFIGLRVCVLLSSGTHASEGEELYRGTIGREIIEGLKMPIWDYQADHYSGGSVLAGLAAVPFFLLFGPTMFSLKLAPLLFAAGTLVLMMIFLKRYFSYEAALLAGLFFTFAPPSFVQLSLVAMGFHSESILFSAFTLLCFYRYFYEGRSDRDLFLFGFSIGLGFWFTHITIITAVSCMAAWLIQDPRSLFERRSKKFFIIGGLIGLLPWFFYNVTHRLEGIGFIVKTLLHINTGGNDGSPSAFGFDFKRLWQLVFEALPMSFGFNAFHNIPGRVLGLVYYLGGLLLFLPLWARAFKNKRLLPIVLQPVIFAAIYWLSSVEMTAVAASDSFYLFFDDCRYFVPFHFSFFLLLGVACSGNWFKRAAAGIFLILGVYGLSTVMFREPWGQVLKFKGYSYAQLGGIRGHVWPQFSSSFEEYLKSLDKYKNPDRYFVYLHSLYGLQFEKDLKNPEKIKRLEALIPPGSMASFAESLGYAAGAQEGISFNPKDPMVELIPADYRYFFFMGIVNSTLFDNLQNVGKYLDYGRQLGEKEREGFYFMLGQFCPFNLGQEGMQMVLNKEHGESETEVRAFFRGVGVRCMLNWMVDGFRFSQAVKNLNFPIPDKYLDDFYRGVGWGVRQQSAEDRERALLWMQELPAASRAVAMEGFVACEKIYGIPS